MSSAGSIVVAGAPGGRSPTRRARFPRPASTRVAVRVRPRATTARPRARGISFHRRARSRRVRRTAARAVASARGRPLDAFDHRFGRVWARALSVKIGCTIRACALCTSSWRRWAMRTWASWLDRTDDVCPRSITALAAWARALTRHARARHFARLAARAPFARDASHARVVVARRDAPRRRADARERNERSRAETRTRRLGRANGAHVGRRASVRGCGTGEAVAEWIGYTRCRVGGRRGGERDAGCGDGERDRAGVRGLVAGARRERADGDDRGRSGSEVEWGSVA